MSHHCNTSSEVFAHPDQQQRISDFKAHVLYTPPSVQLIPQPGFEPRSQTQEEDTLHIFITKFFIPMTTITCLGINLYYWRDALVKFIGN